MRTFKPIIMLAKYPEKQSVKMIMAAFVVMLCVTFSFAQTAEEAVQAQEAFNAGNVLINKGDITSAIEKYSDAIRLVPSWNAPFLNRAVAELSLSKYDEAAADAEKSLHLTKPDSPNSKQHFALAFQIKGAVKMNSRNFEGALADFSKAIEFSPQNAKAMNGKGNALRMLGRFREALPVFDESIQIDPNISVFYVNRGGTHLKLRNNDLALKDLDKAIELDRNNSGAYYMRASVKVEMKLFEDAEKDYDDALRLDPEKPSYYHARGILYSHMNRNESAVKEFSQALSIDPRFSPALGDRAVVLDRLGKTKAAIEDLRSALSMNTNSSTLKYNLSYLLYKEARYAESVEMATEVIAQSPNWRSAYTLRSNGYIKLGMNEKAKADRMKALSLEKDSKPEDDNFAVFDVTVMMPEGDTPQSQQTEQDDEAKPKNNN